MIGRSSSSMLNCRRINKLHAILFALFCLIMIMGAIVSASQIADENDLDVLSVPSFYRNGEPLSSQELLMLHDIAKNPAILDLDEAAPILFRDYFYKAPASCAANPVKCWLSEIYLAIPDVEIPVLNNLVTGSTHSLVCKNIDITRLKTSTDTSGKYPKSKDIAEFTLDVIANSLDCKGTIGYKILNSSLLSGLVPARLVLKNLKLNFQLYAVSTDGWSISSFRAGDTCSTSIGSIDITLLDTSVPGISILNSVLGSMSTSLAKIISGVFCTLAESMIGDLSAMVFDFLVDYLSPYLHEHKPLPAVNTTNMTKLDSLVDDLMLFGNSTVMNFISDLFNGIDETTTVDQWYYGLLNKNIDVVNCAMDVVTNGTGNFTVNTYDFNDPYAIMPNITINLLNMFNVSVGIPQITAGGLNTFKNLVALEVNSTKTDDKNFDIYNALALEKVFGSLNMSITLIPLNGDGYKQTVLPLFETFGAYAELVSPRIELGLRPVVNLKKFWETKLGPLCTAEGLIPCALSMFDGTWEGQGGLKLSKLIIDTAFGNMYAFTNKGWDTPLEQDITLLVDNLFKMLSKRFPVFLNTYLRQLGGSLIRDMGNELFFNFSKTSVEECNLAEPLFIEDEAQLYAKWSESKLMSLFQFLLNDIIKGVSGFNQIMKCVIPDGIGDQIDWSHTSSGDSGDSPAVVQENAVSNYLNKFNDFYTKYANYSRMPLFDISNFSLSGFDSGYKFKFFEPLNTTLNDLGVVFNKTVDQIKNIAEDTKLYTEIGMGATCSSIQEWVDRFSSGTVLDQMVQKTNQRLFNKLCSKYVSTPTTLSESALQTQALHERFQLQQHLLANDVDYRTIFEAIVDYIEKDISIDTLMAQMASNRDEFLLDDIITQYVNNFLINTPPNPEFVSMVSQYIAVIKSARHTSFMVQQVVPTQQSFLDVQPNGPIRGYISLAMPITRRFAALNATIQFDSVELSMQGDFKVNLNKLNNLTLAKTLSFCLPSVLDGFNFDDLDARFNKVILMVDLMLQETANFYSYNNAQDTAYLSDIVNDLINTMAKPYILDIDSAKLLSSLQSFAQRSCDGEEIMTGLIDDIKELLGITENTTMSTFSEDIDYYHVATQAAVVALPPVEPIVQSMVSSFLDLKTPADILTWTAVLFPLLTLAVGVLYFIMYYFYLVSIVGRLVSPWALLFEKGRASTVSPILVLHKESSLIKKYISKPKSNHVYGVVNENYLSANTTYSTAWSISGLFKSTFYNQWSVTHNEESVKTFLKQQTLNLQKAHAKANIKNKSEVPQPTHNSIKVVDLTALSRQTGITLDVLTSSSLLHSPVLSWWFRTLVPVLLVCNLLLIIPALYTNGACVRVIFTIMGELFDMGTVFNFNVTTLIDYMLYGPMGPAMCLFFMFGVFCGFFAFLRVPLFFAMWCLPQRLLPLRARHQLCSFLSHLSRWLLLEAFILSMFLVAFRMNLPLLDQYVVSDTVVRCEPAFFIFLAQSILSHIMASVVIASHRHTMRNISSLDDDEEKDELVAVHPDSKEAEDAAKSQKKEKNTKLNISPWHALMFHKHTMFVISEDQAKSQDEKLQRALSSLKETTSNTQEYNTIKIISNKDVVGESALNTYKKDYAVQVQVTPLGSFVFFGWVALTLLFLYLGVTLDLFTISIGGLSGWFMTDAYHSNTSTVLSVANSIPDANMGLYGSEAGLYFIAFIFYLYIIIVPTLYMVTSVLLWVAPMPLSVHKHLHAFTEALFAWSGVDAFVISVLSSVLDLTKLSAALVGNLCSFMDPFVTTTLGDAGLIQGQNTCFSVLAFPEIACLFLVLAAGGMWACALISLKLSESALIDKTIEKQKLLQLEKKEHNKEVDQEDLKLLYNIEETAGLYNNTMVTNSKPVQKLPIWFPIFEIMAKVWFVTITKQEIIHVSPTVEAYINQYQALGEKSSTFTASSKQCDVESSAPKQVPPVQKPQRSAPSIPARPQSLGDRQAAHMPCDKSLNDNTIEMMTLAEDETYTFNSGDDNNSLIMSPTEIMSIQSPRSTYGSPAELTRTQSAKSDY